MICGHSAGKNKVVLTVRDERNAALTENEEDCSKAKISEQHYSEYFNISDCIKP